MSDHEERNIHDPIIDTLEHCGQEEEGEDSVAGTPAPVPGTGRVDPSDLTNEIGSYNGESLVVTASSPFKKNYNGTSLEGGTVDSLVDAPLPLESEALLPPFRMAPFPHCQKDPHEAFSVSVSDSLPPHVMECDSPEHPPSEQESPSSPKEQPEYHTDKDSDTNMGEPGPELFHSHQGSRSVSPSTSQPSHGHPNTSPLPSPETNTLAPMPPAESEEVLKVTPTKGPFDPFSQPLFDSQGSPGPQPDSPSTLLCQEGEPDRAAPPCDSPPGVGQGERGTLSDNEVLATSHPDPWRRGAVSPQLKMMSDTLPRDGALNSPGLVGEKTGVALATPGRDSDVEILEEDRSIEVVYEGGALSTEGVTPGGILDSQDLKLVLTGETQPPASGVFSQSPSILSTTVGGASEPQTPSPQGARQENTIRATQMEELLWPRHGEGPPSPGKPNVDPLIRLPLLGGAAPPSTNGVPLSPSSQPAEGAALDATPAQQLFPHISQDLPEGPLTPGGREVLQRSRVYAEESDEEAPARVLTPGATRRGRLGGSQKKTFTPLESEGAMDSSLEPGAIGGAPGAGNSSGERLVSPEDDTADVDESVMSLRDLQEQGWNRLGTLAPLEYWVDPRGPSHGRILRMVGSSEHLFRPSDPLSDVVSLSTAWGFVPGGDRRASSGSSLSRVTSLTMSSTSSSGYLADRSASSSSTSRSGPRLSSAPTLPSPPPGPHDTTTTSTSSSFRLPQPPPLTEVFPPPPAGSSVPTRDAQMETEAALGGAVPLRRAGRTARGRTKRTPARAPPTKDPPPPVEEESPQVPAPGGSEGEDLSGLLSEDLRGMLAAAQIPLTEDEEEMFLLGSSPAGGGCDPGGEATARQLEEIQRRVRKAAVSPGALVFARYLDNNYYSALVQKPLGPDQWEVYFTLDDLRYRVREMYLLPTEVLPRGTRCFVRRPDHKYSDSGVVRGLTHGGGATPLLLHVVETDRGRVLSTPHSQISLSQRVAEALLDPRRAFHSMMASPGGDVSLDNVVPGKLRRTPRGPGRRVGASTKPDPRLDSSDAGEGVATAPRLPTPRSRRVPTTAERTSSSDGGGTPRERAKRATVIYSPRAKSPKIPMVKLTQLNEESPRGQRGTPSKKRSRKPGSGRGSSRKAMRVEEDTPLPPVDPLLGPLPSPGCQIFAGYSILITHAQTPAHPDPDRDIPLNREYLKRQILGGGGQVLDTFEESNLLHVQTLQRARKAPSSGVGRVHLHDESELPAGRSPSRVICVSNSFCRTAKFIQCLTVGIPLVDSQWVAQSLMQNAPKNWLQFLLPAGLSLTGELMEQPFKDDFKDTFSAVGNVVDILEGKKVFLASSSDPRFCELWSALLAAARANVHKMPLKAGNLQRIIDRRTAVVMADASIPDPELRRAKEVGVPVVSSEWFIQSVIARCPLHYDAHPDFRHTHKPLAPGGPTPGPVEDEDGFER